MPTVRVEPLGIAIDAQAGETVMDAVAARGYYWPTSCNRNGECTTCAMEVVRGIEALSPMGRYERTNIARQRGEGALTNPTLRLACQARVLGDVTVRKRGVVAAAGA